MTKKTLALATAILLSACGTTANQTYTGDGELGYRISCGGFFGDGDTGGCYQKAGELCGSQGYRILQTSISSMIIACRSPGEASSHHSR